MHAWKVTVIEEAVTNGKSKRTQWTVSLINSHGEYVDSITCRRKAGVPRLVALMFRTYYR